MFVKCAQECKWIWPPGSLRNLLLLNTCASLIRRYKDCSWVIYLCCNDGPLTGLRTRTWFNYWRGGQWQDRVCFQSNGWRQRHDAVQSAIWPWRHLRESMCWEKPKKRVVDTCNASALECWKCGICADVHLWLIHIAQGNGIQVSLYGGFRVTSDCNERSVGPCLKIRNVLFKASKWETRNINALKRYKNWRRGKVKVKIWHVKRQTMRVSTGYCTNI